MARGESRPTVAERARTASADGVDTCRVPGCSRITQRAAGNGLSAYYCKPHVNHNARHGSYWLPSLKATDLKPYRRAARAWLDKHKSDEQVRTFTRELDGLLRLGAGQDGGLKGLGATDKARATLGRLHASGVTGTVLLEVALAVASLIASRGIISTEYLEVQMAKVLTRMHAPSRASAWRPSESRARTTGRGLRVLGHHVWFMAAFVGTRDVLTEVAEAAMPFVGPAQRAEARRQSANAQSRAMYDAIERQILRAREYGMGPAELDEMRTTLRQRYGLK